MRRFGACLGLLVACGGKAEIDERAVVSGTVVDSESVAAIEGAILTVVPATYTTSTATDLEGSFRFFARYGIRHQVTARAPGYQDVTLDLTPSPQTNNTLAFRLSLQRICQPGRIRCAEGALDTCGPSGNLWVRSQCPANQACDPTVGCAEGRSVRVTVEGPGAVSSQPAGILCGESCEKVFALGSEIVLTANPLALGEFVGWTGACTDSQPICRFRLDSNQTVGATFRANGYLLRIRKRGQGGGRVTSAPAGIDCGATCQAGYPEATEVTLTAAPDGRSVFSSWGGACSGSQPTCVVRMDQQREVDANFAIRGVALTVEKDGTGTGVLTSDPAGIDCGDVCVAGFNPGAMVTLTAAADPGSSFGGFGGDCAPGPECTLRLDQARTARATFELEAATVVVAVTGQGRVRSSPAGIDCGSNCMATFDVGQQVTLTAEPGPGQGFAGWSGACAGAGNNLNCVLTVNAGQNVGAAFEPFYRLPLAADASCVWLVSFEAPNPLVSRCGNGSATVLGNWTNTPSRTTFLGTALQTVGPQSNGPIDTQRLVAPPATLELTVRRDGPAFGAGYASLWSDWDQNDPNTHGLRLSLLDDGRLVASTRDLAGQVSTATSAATLSVGTWAHVRFNLSSNGFSVRVDNTEVATFSGPIAYTASSSTAWVGAERGVSSTARLNGVVDEVRISNVVRNP